jgi:hypothetical protein
MIINKLVPNIGFMEYKILKSKVTSWKTRSISDYYSRGTEGRWETNLRQLLKLIEDRKSAEDLLKTDVNSVFKNNEERIAELEARVVKLTEALKNMMEK